MLICGIYAVLDELYQGFFSVGRACESVDLLKDWAGSGLAIFLVWLIKSITVKKLHVSADDN